MSEKQSVALYSLFASAGLAMLKLAAGLLTGSLGILSEAIHGVLDFGATVITLVAVRWADQPPDEVHQYGHGKAESIAALIETGLLFATTGWIVYEAVHRLWTGSGDVLIAWWAFAIIGLSVVVDFNRSRALLRVAEKTSSEALEADALHFSSDMWSSLVVLFGLGAVWAGYGWADPVSALIVAFFVSLAAWRLGQRTLATLLDAAPEGATERIGAILTAEPGVLAINRLRLRPAGGKLFVGAVVDIPRTTAVDNIVALKARLEAAITSAYPQADTTVTANPVSLDSETVFERVMLIAQRQAQAIHHLTVQRVGERMAVSFDLEVEGGMALGAAHEVATHLEDAVRAELGADVEVESHIEPLPDTTLTGHAAPAETAEPIIAALQRLAAAAPGLSDLHDIRVRQSDIGIFVHYHCRFAAVATVEQVHAALDHIDHDLREQAPEVRRVIAHAEPVGRKRHSALKSTPTA